MFEEMKEEKGGENFVHPLSGGDNWDIKKIDANIFIYPYTSEPLRGLQSIEIEITRIPALTRLRATLFCVYMQVWWCMQRDKRTRGKINYGSFEKTKNSWPEEEGSEENTFYRR